MKLHGGSVRVESTVGGGSIFSVTIPLGAAHLPADRVGTPRTLSSTAVGAGAFVEEALRWLPDEETSRAFPGTVGNAREAFPPGASASRPPGARAPDEVVAKRPRILWADDNADMRQYVRRLLGERYDVEAVPDGEAALEAARARPPDLVLSDVMMPRLDGFGLLNALRADPATRAIPVILLSARAGEESRVEGLEAGADDYLVKPFSARELLARVGANLEMARVRREAGERVTHLMESIPDGLITLDREWRYTFVNTPAEPLLGRPRSDLLGKCVWDEYPSGVGTEVERQLRRAAADRVMCEFEGQDAGRGRWFENRAFPMPEGGVAVYFRDITERRRAEEALRQSEERFRRYFDLGLIGMAITSPTKGCLEVNAEICRIFGYTRDEFLRKTWAEMTHPDDLAADVAQFDRVMAGEVDGYTMDKRWIRKDGRIIDTTISVKCVRHRDGSVDYFVALLQDVTERKRAEEALRRSEAQTGRGPADRPHRQLELGPRERRDRLVGRALPHRRPAAAGGPDDGRTVRELYPPGRPRGRLDGGKAGDPGPSALRVVPAPWSARTGQSSSPSRGDRRSPMRPAGRADVWHDPGRHRADAGRGGAAPGRVGAGQRQRLGHRHRPRGDHHVLE